MKIETIITLLLVALYAAAVCLAEKQNAIDENIWLNTYCARVWENKADPWAGWPDYKHIYKQQCERDHARKDDR